MSEEQKEIIVTMYVSCTECGIRREGKDWQRHHENCSRYQDSRYDHDYLDIDNPWQEGYIK